MSDRINVDESPFWADRLVHAVGAIHVIAQSGRAMVRPGAPAELCDVVRIAGEVGARVGVGLGAGNHDGIEVDLSRMCNVLHLDETSLVVTAQAGITFDALERALGERGLMLGAVPSWARLRTVGALLAAPRPSEASPRLGRFVHTCLGIQALLPDGTEIATRLAPRKATGPDLMHAIVGARGTLGMITAATLRVQRRQDTRLSAAFAHPTLPSALSAARALLVRGGRPVELTVSAAGVVSLDVDGPEPLAAAEVALAAEVTRAHGGEPVPHAPPPRWLTPPHERGVALERVDAEVLAPALVGDAVRVVGWHTGGACVVDSARPPAAPPALSPLVAALKKRLDPQDRFVAWPVNDRLPH
ncbi:MAG TPA: FAD-binding oxidoreductase [Polyangia bacterium]